MLNLVICSREEELFQGRADSVSVPAQEGDFQILSGHAPLLGLLEKGKIRLRSGKEEKSFDIQGGIIEVHNNEVSLLVR